MVKPDRYKMTWWKEHLNWSWVILQLLVSTVELTFLGIISSYLDKFWIFMLVVVYASVILIDIWYLKQKSRSLWFLGFQLIPSFLKIIAFLSLENRSYYCDLGINVIGPFHSKDEISNWYNSIEDWNGVEKVEVFHKK